MPSVVEDPESESNTAYERAIVSPLDFPPSNKQDQDMVVDAGGPIP